MSFLGKNTYNNKNCSNNNVFKQVSCFDYLGCDISYRKDQDIVRQLDKLDYTCVTIRHCGGTVSYTHLDVYKRQVFANESTVCAL